LVGYVTDVDAVAAVVVRAERDDAGVAAIRVAAAARRTATDSFHSPSAPSSTTLPSSLAS